MVASTAAPQKPVLPRHVAIIMDGNGRWAEGRGLARSLGHQGGIEPVRTVVHHCADLGIEALTLFAFSSENFSRPADEVGRLMALFLDALERELDELDGSGIRLRFIGNTAELDPVLVAATQAAEQRTAANKRLDLVVALGYGGRWDIVQAARAIAERVRAGRIEPADIGEQLFASRLATSGLPPVDLLIRTGGEQRLSNFLLWDLAYSELYFSDRLWPEFDRAELDRALEFFQLRQRRFGRTGHQVRLGAC